MVNDSGTADSTEQLGGFVGELLGDFSSDLMPEASAAPETPPPASTESPDPSVTDAPPVDGTAPVEPASTPSPDAPADPAAAPAIPFDPETAFADDPVLTYTVNGVQKTHDGIRIVDGSGFIRPSALPDIQRKLGERDHLVDTNRQLYDRTKQFDALTFREGPKGQEKEYRGVEAFAQMRASLVNSDRSGEQAFKALYDPKVVTALALAYQAGDQAEVKRVIAEIADRALFVGEKAAFEARRTFGEQHQATIQQGDAAGNREARFNENFTNAKAALPHLTDADVVEAKEIYGAVKGSLYRAATLEDAQKYGVKVGEELYDPTAVNAWLVKRNAQNEERAKANKVSEQASVANKARLATTVRPKAAPVAPRRPEKPTDQKGQDADEAWDLRERLASARLIGTR